MEGFVVLIWIICGIAGYSIGNAKGRGPTGLLLGLLLGVFGIIIIAVMGPADLLRCPACHGPVSTVTTVCPHCRTVFAEWARTHGK